MKKTKFKKGAASFYVVAFSTLILLIIAASFTALVVAQITRSSNADLAQSAYDSALAGVEDAKLAFYSYRSCLNQGAVAKAPVEGEAIGCDEIVYMMENSENEDCGMVAEILGRTDEGVGVMVEETSGNNMQQAYTCVKIRTKLRDYSASLSADEQMRVIRPRFDDGISAKDIKSIRLSWGQKENQVFNFSSFDPVFPSAAKIADILNPPVLSVAILQAGTPFNLSSFDLIGANRTNRGLVFLVPRDASSDSGVTDNYIVANDKKILAGDWVKSNDRTSVNKPYAIDCDLNAENYLCTASLQLPDTIEDGGRSDENFAVIVASPYGKSTDFKLEFCINESACSASTEEIAFEESEMEANSPVILKGVQLGVDSTGRANDLYRRVETRLVEKDDSVLSIMGPLELFGDKNAAGGAGQGNGAALEKNLSVTCEWNLPYDEALLNSNGCL